MKHFTIYTTILCPYCTAAKRLLSEKGMQNTEIDVTADPASRAVMAKRAGGKRSVPQIFVGGKHIGGYQEMYFLNMQDGLAPILSDR